MKIRFFSLLVIFVFGTCNLPSLQHPSVYFTLTQLLRSQPVQGYGISIIYDNREYLPDETLDLGLGMVDDPRTIPIIVKNNGQLPFELNTENSPQITSNTGGSLDLEASMEVPNIWEPGFELSVDMVVTASGSSENLWEISFQLAGSSEAEFKFPVRMLSMPAVNYRLFYSRNNPAPVHGVYSSTWNPESEVLENEIQHSTSSAAAISSDKDNKFVYFTDQNTAMFRGFRMDTSSTLVDIPGIPTGGFYSRSFTIPNTNRLMVLGSGSTSRTIDYNQANGALGTPVGSLGHQCNTGYFNPSPKGDYIFVNHFLAFFGGRTQVMKVEGDGTLSDIYAPPIYYEDANLQNRHSITLKTLSNDYFFTASHIGVPGVDNIKVDSILRRSVLPDGTFSVVDNEYIR